jgi:hypothetical protein
MENYVPGADWIDGSSFPYASASDHASFWDAGIPAIFINDCLDNNSVNFNNFFHTSLDVMGTSVNNNPLTEACVRTATALIADLAICTPFSGSVKDNDMYFSVFPNPVQDYFVVKFGPELSEFRIIDIFGRTKLQIVPQTISEITVSTKTLNSGVFFLLAVVDKKVLRRVIIKQ